MPHLKFLSLLHADLSRGIDFLKGLNELNQLQFFNCKNILLNWLVPPKLESLVFDRCKKIDRIETIFELKKIRNLSFIDSITLNSASDFIKFDELETLIVLGKSYFIDGNIKVLKNKLKHFSFDDKRHYNVKYEEFKKLFLKK